MVVLYNGLLYTYTMILLLLHLYNIAACCRLTTNGRLYNPAYSLCYFTGCKVVALDEWLLYTSFMLLLTQSRETQMNYKVTRTDDGFWAVTDEMGTHLAVEDTRSRARELAREMNMPAPTTHKIEGYYGTGTGPVEVIAEAAVEVDTVVDEVTETATVDTATEATDDFVDTECNADGKPLMKSQRVRLRITYAKANNQTDEVVVKWAVDTLGMQRQLARAYVKNNWHKA
jgi:hypothetical protein